MEEKVREEGKEMRNELEKKLIEKFPKIFRDVGLTPQESCMAFGCECDDGWFDLLNELCTEIQVYLDKNKNCKQVVAAQVKEKFGGLRFYYDGGDEVTETFVMRAEQESEKICEKCGKEGTIGGKSWLKCLCKNCNNEK